MYTIQEFERNFKLCEIWREIEEHDQASQAHERSFDSHQSAMAALLEEAKHNTQVFTALQKDTGGLISEAQRDAYSSTQKSLLDEAEEHGRAAQEHLNAAREHHRLAKALLAVLRVHGAP